MSSPVHAFTLDLDKCKGLLLCMRTCPTEAIRVREGKAEVIDARCIDCGECIATCPEGAFIPLTPTWDSLKRYAFNIAIPSPTIFAQFPMDVTPADVVNGLTAIGFDAVYDSSVECEIINRAIADYLDVHEGKLPLISSSCAVVVRLIQVAYPEMVDQVIPIELPRELAAEHARRKYMLETGLQAEDIGITYISPCPAKIVSIQQPAEGVRSYLNAGIGINEIYNPLFAAITKLKKEPNSEDRQKWDELVKSRIRLHWATRGGQCSSLNPSRYVSVSQLPNVIRVLDEVEMGKIKGVEFLECYACPGGCVGGPFTVDDMYVSRSKLLKLMSNLGDDPNDEAAEEAAARYEKGDYFIRKPLKPRPGKEEKVSFEEKIMRMKTQEDMLRALPMVDCGLCGSPTCTAFAADVAQGKTNASRCIFLDDRRIRDLRKVYKIDP